jgi:hypothetical protein
MKVHSSLKKRPMVLFELLVCMGVLSYTNSSANAIHLTQLASQRLYSQNHLDINALMQVGDEPADQQQTQTEGGEATGTEQ